MIRRPLRPIARVLKARETGVDPSAQWRTAGRTVDQCPESEVMCIAWRGIRVDDKAIFH